MNELLNPSITIFGFQIYYYAIVIVVGLVLATCLSALMMKRRNMSPDFVFTLFIFCIPSALICARLYYCVTDGMHVSDWFRWESIRSGGLSILGGVLGGVLAGLIVCLVKRVNFFRAADCVVPTILIAQAIGRWGNYFNQEVYGSLITDPAWQWFPWAVEIGGNYYHALFFYESVINTIGFLLIYGAAWNFIKKPNGLFAFLYFAWYGSVRALMEPLRNSQYILGDGIMWSQVTSIIMAAAALVAIAILLAVNYKKEGSLIGSRKGDPCAITEFAKSYKDEVPYFSKINLLGANYPPKPAKTPKAKGKDKEKK